MIVSSVFVSLITSRGFEVSSGKCFIKYYPGGTIATSLAPFLLLHIIVIAYIYAEKYSRPLPAPHKVTASPAHQHGRAAIWHISYLVRHCRRTRLATYLSSRVDTRRPPSGARTEARNWSWSMGRMHGVGLFRRPASRPILQHA